MPVHVPPEVVTQLLDVLQGLGVSQHVLEKFCSKASQTSQNARVVPGRTRRLAELEEKWLKATSHLEVLREQMTRKEHEYLASVEKFETHGKQVQSLEEEYGVAKTLLRSQAPSVHDDAGADVKDSVSDMDVRDVDDVDEHHDLDLIACDTCKGEAVRWQCKGPASHASSSKLGL